MKKIIVITSILVFAAITSFAQAHKTYELVAGEGYKIVIAYDQNKKALPNSIGAAREKKTGEPMNFLVKPEVANYVNNSLVIPEGKQLVFFVYEIGGLLELASFEIQNKEDKKK